MERFDIEQVIRILGLEMRAEQADEGRDFDVACRIALDKLKECKEYEDLEEQGLLLRLHCKVGDTAWYVDNDDDNYPIEIQITGIEIKENYILYFANEKEDCGTLGFINDDFNKTIFLTKAEAEQKLKEWRIAMITSSKERKISNKFSDARQIVNKRE